MITVLTGENYFLLKTQLRQLINDFVAEYTDLGLEQLDGYEASYNRIREALESMPFLASRKLVVLKKPSSNKEFAENAIDILSDIPDVIDVVIVEPKPDKRTTYYKYLKKNSEIIELNVLDENGLARWAADRVKQLGGQLLLADAKYLVQRVGTNQQLLSNEIEKLLNYNLTVNRQSIDLLTDVTPQSSIFDLLDAALSGKLVKAIELYEEQRAMKVEPQQILAMLAWQLHLLAVVKSAKGKDSGAVAKDAKIKPFAVRKTQNLARYMSLGQISRLVARTLSLDIKLKSQSIDADDAIKYLLLSLNSIISPTTASG